MRKINSMFNTILPHLIYTAFICAILIAGCAVRTTHAAETRGLRVVAKDPSRTRPAKSSSTTRAMPSSSALTVIPACLKTASFLTLCGMQRVLSR